MMRFERFTERAQDAAIRAAEILQRYGHNQVDTEHLLLALLEQPDGVIPQLLERMTIDVSAMRSRLDEVLRAIQATNTNLPAGNISYGADERLVRIEGKIKDARGFNKIIVARRASGPVYLEQVAEVVDGEQEEMSISRINGVRAITLEVTKIQDANVVEVGTGIKLAVEKMQKTLPADIKLSILEDQSQRVQSQLDNVKRTIIEGAILTMLIVFLFLLYYGLPNLGVTLSPFVIAVFGFTLNVSAYNARYLTIAYKGLDQAELQSARAQGFSPFQVFRLITAPQSLRMSVPSLTNQAIQNIKDSSIVFLIQYIEFFAQMQEVAGRTFLFFKTYLFTAFVYLLLVSVVVLVARRMERKLAIPGLG